MGNKTFDFSSKKKDFLPKNDQIWPKIGIFGQFGPGHEGLFGALLVGRLVVVARGLYLQDTYLLYIILCYHMNKICYLSTTNQWLSKSLHLSSVWYGAIKLIFYYMQTLAVQVHPQ